MTPQIGECIGGIKDWNPTFSRKRATEWGDQAVDFLGLPLPKRHAKHFNGAFSISPHQKSASIRFHCELVISMVRRFAEGGAGRL
jgi:hypothetical protein